MFLTHFFMATFVHSYYVPLYFSTIQLPNAEQSVGPTGSVADS